MPSSSSSRIEPAPPTSRTSIEFVDSVNRATPSRSGTVWLPWGTVMSRSVGSRSPVNRTPLICCGVSHDSRSVGRRSRTSGVHAVRESLSTAPSAPAAGSPARFDVADTSTPGGATGIWPPSAGSTVPSRR
jgi:hypothetical protein